MQISVQDCPHRRLVDQLLGSPIGVGTPRRLTHQKLAILGLARRRDCTDSIRLYGRYEHHEAQRSDGQRGETQNVLQISSYPFSTSRRTGASAAGSVANSDAAGFL